MCLGSLMNDIINNLLDVFSIFNITGQPAIVGKKTFLYHTQREYLKRHRFF